MHECTGRPVNTKYLQRFLSRQKKEDLSEWEQILISLPNGQSSALGSLSVCRWQVQYATLRWRNEFSVRALQVDGGSEFAPEFRQGCQKRRLRPFVLPPRSPKLKGMVERAQHIHTEEFYEVFHCSLELAGLNRELLRPLGQDVRGDAGARHRSSTPSTTSRTASRASMRL